LSKTEVDANNFLHVISDYLPENAIICSDVGQNQMCTAQTLKLDYERKLLNSAGYGSMGYSLPAAIGASYASDKKTCVLSINGDGGIQMNIQELETLKRDQLPVNVIILNNNCLGMLRKLQENMYESRYIASVIGYSVPNFSAIAKAYGINYMLIDSVEKYELFKDFISDKNPTITEVILPQCMNNIPEPGPSIEKQVPKLSDEEFALVKKECNF
jgi:acetolactate synthase-1/2/3 large subunit